MEPHLDDTIWPGKELAHWRNLTSWIEELRKSARLPRTILFRGQSKRWPLRPTLLRTLPFAIEASRAVTAERDALRHFQSQVHLHAGDALPPFDGMTGTLLDWWALMQHHQAPTRLLDWSASPYVALYFAAERDFDQSGVVLVIDGDQVAAHFDRLHHGAGTGEAFFQNLATAAGIRTYTPHRKTARLVVQQGYFTVATGVLGEHDPLLHDAGAIIGQWIIPAALKLDLLAELRTMNVTASTLFPGLDGLGRSTGEIVRTIT